MVTLNPHLVQLHPRDRTRYISHGQTVWISGRDGFINANEEQGLFVRKTRLISSYRLFVDGRSPDALALSAVEQHSWLGYYRIPWKSQSNSDGQRAVSPRNAIELRVSRFVGDGCHEDLDLTSYLDRPVTLRFQIELDADFADQQEVIGKKRQQEGRVSKLWHETGADGGMLVFDYRAEHHYEHHGEQGDASIHRGLTLRIDRAASAASWEDGRITFAVELQPRGGWHVCLNYVPLIDDEMLEPIYGCRDFTGGKNDHDRRRGEFLRRATRVSVPGSGALTPVVVGAVEQATRDLAALRLYEFDDDPAGWVVAGGVPTYTNLFGRDPLLSGMLASMLGQGMLGGVLAVLARWQGTRCDDWRDEQPGRMLHQMQDSPLSALNFSPLGLYYGSLSTPPLYCQAVAELWAWTGDLDAAARWIEPALKGLRWLDQYADEDRDGFYEIKTRSEKGLKNQGLMDSGTSIVYEDGTIASAPVATAQTQSIVYAAKKRLALLLHWLGRQSEARRLEQEAELLKTRFNDRFWVENEEYYAFGLDPQKRPIIAVDSTSATCLASGIADDARVRAVADRLWQEDLFTGWGIRSLSSRNPAYNPLSYQRGSVWPVENAKLALGFFRCGLFDDLTRLCRAQYDAASLFAHYRLPEVFSGHPRDADHPFPAPQEQANWPQAWSSAAIVCYLQTLLGIVPFAPAQLLLLDPHLPDWLPEITVSGLRIGHAAASIRFWRDGDGGSNYEVLDLRGPLHIVGEALPGSLFTGTAAQIKDRIEGLAAVHVSR